MPRLRALAGAFDKVSLFVCCALVTALLGCVSLGALTRGLGEPLIWTDELSRFLMVWLAVFGWIVASRKLGGAVVRNRAKRLIREVFRTTNPPGTALDLVVIPKPSAADQTPAELGRDYQAALKRLNLSK